MGSGWVPWAAALLVNPRRPDSSLRQGTDAPEDFVVQAKADCYFTNGTEKVQSVVRFIYNLEECARSDSDVGMAVAPRRWGSLTPSVGRGRAERSRAALGALCRPYYKQAPSLWGDRVMQPDMAVYPERAPLLQQHDLLLCSVTGFYPGDIKSRWFRNGHEERVGVMSAGLVRNGDWTFQTMVMLEMTPELGDSPASAQWTAQSDYPWRKMLSGVAAFQLGLIFWWGCSSASGLREVVCPEEHPAPTPTSHLQGSRR
uniref:Major histocompatibility complex, class II, DO beta n=1 Tax=Microcebus murinus TaxID=30608 RepID=A0A8C5XQE0_MICMU